MNIQIAEEPSNVTSLTDKRLNKKLGEALLKVAHFEGLPQKEEILLPFSVANDYLAVRVIAQMIEAGDVKLEIVNDSLGKREYLERILK